MDNNKNLKFSLKKSGGRNNKGRTTVFTKSGGHRRSYRFIDFKRNLLGIPARVIKIEYDPNRCVDIALIMYTNGLISYILKPLNLNINDYIISGKNIIFGNIISHIGSCLFLKDIREGEFFHNMELKKNSGGIIARSGGVFLKLLKNYNNIGYSLIKMPSKEYRLISINCKGTIGILSNEDNYLQNINKAGRSRWLGIKPNVRGVAMNPVDHPHGGNTGESRPSVSPWSRLTKGKPTRKKNKSNKFIFKKNKNINII
jgi:large subunit ribosomal protein L2